jgi:hypothetical protein
MKQHRKCDSSKYKKRVSREKANKRNRADRNLQMQREYDLKWGTIKREAARKRAEDYVELQKGRLRIANLLSFWIWRRDPDFYNIWAKARGLDKILGAYFKGVGFYEN